MPDLKDILIVLGAGLLGYGLWQIWPPLAFVVIGALAIAWGVRGYERKYREVKDGAIQKPV